MGNFRSDNRDRGFGGGGFRGRGGFRDREGGFERRRPEMHEVTCSKCGKQCEVPFKPTGDKPVFCSDCFKTEGGSSSRGSSSGISQEQFKELNAKLDKLLAILEKVEFTDEDSEESEEEAEEEEKEAEESKEEAENSA